MLVWLSLYLCWILGAIFLLAPGMLVARGLRTDWHVAFMLSPLLSFGIYGVLAIIYGSKGIPCGWMTLAIPTAIVGAALCLLGRLFKLEPAAALSLSSELKQPLSERHRMPRATLSLIVAMLVGVITSTVVWATAISAPDVFAQLYDNGFHLTRIAQFMDEANYSSFMDGPFYPSGWHLLAAMVGSAVGVTAPVAENASLLIIASAAYPPSCVLLLSTLFGDKPRRVFLGSLACLSIAFFPWRPMLWGPLYPNLAAFCVMPAAVALFIRLVRDASGIRDRLLPCLLFLLGGVAMVILQPNAIFSCGVFLIPFCLSCVRQAVTNRRGLRAGIIAEVLAAMVFAGIWLGLVYAPFMEGVVWYTRNNVSDYMQAIRWGLDLCFVLRRPQYQIGAVLVLGGLAVLRERNTRWLAPAYAMTLLLYVAAFGISSPLKNIISGFWYSDPWRLAAADCVFAIPLIACGLDALVGLAMWPFTRPSVSPDGTKTPRRPGVAAYVAATAVIAVIAVLNYVPIMAFPDHLRSWCFDTVRHNVWTTTDPYLYEYAPLPPEEGAFLERAAQITGDDKVFNQPFDGSGFAYSVYGMNTEFRTFGPGNGKTARLLRNSINRVSWDKMVQQQVKELGIVYVVQLDQGYGKTGMNMDTSYLDLGYDRREWVGFNSIRDDTPGFTVVLSEGDMRLYKLDIPA